MVEVFRVEVFRANTGTAAVYLGRAGFPLSPIDP